MLLLHAAGHLGAGEALLCHLVDLLLALHLLHRQVLFVALDSTKVRHGVGSELWAPAIGHETFFSVTLLGHLSLVALPEREGCLACLCDLERLLLDTQPPLLVLVLDLLIARDEHGGWDGLVAELVLDHVLLLYLLLHNHLVDFALAGARLLRLLVPNLKVEGFGQGHAVPALSQRLLTDLVHVVACRDPLLVQVAAAQGPSTPVPTSGILALEVV